MLPCWLEYHKNVFDYGIIIDWDSTDKSREIIKKICPHWEIRRTTNLVNDKPFFDQNMDQNLTKMGVKDVDLIIDLKFGDTSKI
jgi:hypothetical protein